MKPSKKAKFRNEKYLRYIIPTAAVLLISAVLAAFLLSGTSPAALADSKPATLKDDTFSVLFPTVSYIQSDDPTLIAANDSYLIIYDKTAKTMFVRGGDRIGTYAFPINLENVEYINAVGNTAFIYADRESYTLDLKDVKSSPVKCELSSPAEADYFRSDGKYLYAKNVYGAISIYDENLELAEFEIEEEAHTVTVDNDTYKENGKPVFVGNQVLAGDNHLMYFFTTERSEPFFIVYDPVSQQRHVYEQMTNYVSEAFVGSNVIVGQLALSDPLALGDSRLVGIDKGTGKTLFSSNVIPDSFCVYGDMIYTIEGKQIMTYRLEKSSGGNYSGFRKVSTISMSGADIAHLGNPSDVVTCGSSLAVADTDNNRVGFINSASVMTAVDLDSAPLRLTADLIGVYVLLNDTTVIKIENGETVQTISAETAVDITYLDKLYILTGDGLYTVLGGETLKLAQTTGAKRLTSAKDGANLYVLKDECIEIYATNGTLISTLTHDFSDVKDISVDYSGQIFALREDGFDVYVNDGGTPTLSSSTEFYNATAHAKANSVCIENNSIYFSTLECLIGKSAVTAYDKESFKPASFVPSADAIYHFAKLKENTFSYVIPSSGRMEAISPAPTETVLVFDNDGSDWAYALLNGEFFKIKQADYDTVETEDLVGDYAAKNNTALYSLPNVTGGKLSVLAGTRFTLIGDCADFESSKWLRVNYHEKTYFVLYDDCDEFIELIRDEDRQYGKAKAKRVGGLVNVYADASSDAEVLISIVDGTEIEVLDKLDRYYMVRYEGTVGYMLKSEVELDGLTTVQIIAIVVACLVAVAGVGIFIAIETTKKKAAEAERRAERKQK